MKSFPELRRKILEDMLGPSYDAYVNFKREPVIPKKRQHRKRIPLWRFLLHLLYLDQQSNLVQWIDAEDLKFKIKSPIDVAQLWGSIKDKSDMTYEKLGRAMRYYYGKSIIEKVCGLRYTYRFIVSRKTKRHLDVLAKRRSSTHSLTDTETATGSESTGSESTGSESTGSESTGSMDCDDSLDDASLHDEGCLFLNEDDPKPVKDCDMLCEHYTYINSLEQKQYERNMNEEITQLFMDDCCWPSPHEIFLGIEKVAVNKGGYLDDEDFTPESNSYFNESVSIFDTANPDDIFFSG